ncbi:MAG: hypothetical protein QOI69_2737 [Pseudonocardiales bacterium]|nr:hypothetical protein [Pseudonocardiales bacterium]
MFGHAAHDLDLLGAGEAYAGVSCDCALDCDLVQVVVVRAGVGLVRVRVWIFVDVVPCQGRQPPVLGGVRAGGAAGVALRDRLPWRRGHYEITVDVPVHGRVRVAFTDLAR